MNWGVGIVPEKKAYIIERFGKYVKTHDSEKKAYIIESINSDTISCFDYHLMEKSFKCQNCRRFICKILVLNRNIDIYRRYYDDLSSSY